jgi:cytoskeletal protein RodZ
MNGGDTGKVFVGEYRVEAVRGKTGELAGLRLQLDANVLLKLLTDPAEPTRTTLELVGVHGARAVSAPAFALPETLVARTALGVAVLGLAALLWVVAGMFSANERAVDWPAQRTPTTFSAPPSTPPTMAAPRTPPVVESPAASPPTSPPPSAPIRLLPVPAASAPQPALTPKPAATPAVVAQAVPRTPKANTPARQGPVTPAARTAAPSSAPASSPALAAAPSPASHAPSANVLDLFNDTK